MSAAIVDNVRYQIDDLVLDTRLGTLQRDEQEIPLPQLSYRLWCVLVQQAPAIVSQDELMEKVWGEQIVSDETLKQRIKLLRQALGDTPQTPKYIESVRGRGYRCIAEVKSEQLKPRVSHDSINLRLNDRLPVSLAGVGGRYWRWMSIFFLMVFTAFITAVTINYFVKPTANPTEPPQQAEQTPTDNQARQAYQKGRQFYLRYTSLDNEMAIKSYLKAIALDPGFAAAHAGLADAYSQGIFQFGADSSWQKKALGAAFDAVMLDDTRAQSYKALGTAHYVAGHLSQALSANLKAVQLEPDFIEAQANLGYIYSERGELRNALERHLKVYQLNPDHQVNWFHIALTTARLGQSEIAKRWYQKVLAARPDYHLATAHYSRLLLSENQSEHAFSLLRQAEQLSPDSVNVLKALSEYHLLSQGIEQAKPWIHKLHLLSSGENRLYGELLGLLTAEASDITAIQRWYEDHSGDYNERALGNIQLAMAATALGSHDMALRHLAQAIELGWRDRHYLINMPLLAPLRELPRFERVLALCDRKLAADLKATQPLLGKLPIIANSR